MTAFEKRDSDQCHLQLIQKRLTSGQGGRLYLVNKGENGCHVSAEIYSIGIV